FSDQRDYRFTPQGNGRYTGYVTSKKVGSDVIGFTTDQGQAAGKTATVEYFAGNLDTENSVITASPATITADGKERSRLTVQLKDSNGNDLANNISKETGRPYQVVLKLEGGGSFVGDVENVTMIPATDGQFFTYVTSTLAGSDTFTFEIDNRPASSSATVTYTAGKADASTSIIRSMPDSIEVSAGEITSTLTVE
ncbi:Ig-like domain-containing protein, partial [Ignatzschineria sp. LJL83]